MAQSIGSHNVKYVAGTRSYGLCVKYLRVAFSTPTFAIRVYVPGERGLQRLERGEDCPRVLPEDWRGYRTERHASARGFFHSHICHSCLRAR